ncbi:transcriptional regulator [Clostridia bacterium]|nr:transcriptional regulator [Clostridia bacterium]
MLNERLKETRVKNGFRQKELAELLSISPARYNQYETGRREPDNQTLSLLAQTLFTTTDFLLGVSAPEQIPQNAAPESNPAIIAFYQRLVSFNGGAPLSDAQIDSLLNFFANNEDYAKYILQKNK